MRRSRHWWWIAFGGCVAAVVAALGWISGVVLGLEFAERAARADAQEQETVRLALWRMDSWLAPLLAREAARPYFEYQAFYPGLRAYNKVLGELDPSEVLTRSSLVAFKSELFPLHFQYEADGTLSSPQVPTGNYRELAEVTCLPGPTIDDNNGSLGRVGRMLPFADLSARLGPLETQVVEKFSQQTVAEVAPAQSAGGPQPQQALGNQSQLRRGQILYGAKQAAQGATASRAAASRCSTGSTPWSRSIPRPLADASSRRASRTCRSEPPGGASASGRSDPSDRRLQFAKRLATTNPP